MNRQAYLYAIGIDDYNTEHFALLQFCGNDAQAIAELLEQKIANLHVSLFISRAAPNKEISHQQLRDVLKTISELVLGEEDLVLFYFAGHGFARSGRDYLVASDSGAWGETTIAMDEVVAAMVESGAGTTVLIIDACRLASRANEEFGYWTRALAQRRGAVVFFGCSPGEVCQEIALGADGGHGVFTFALLSVLRTVPHATPIVIDQSVGTRTMELVAERKLAPQRPYTTVNPLQKASYDLFTGRFFSGVIRPGERRECVIVAGPTHAGKSSIGQFLANEFNFLHVEMSSFAWQRYEQHEAAHDFPGSLQDFMEQVVWGKHEYDTIARELISKHVGINRLVITGPRRVEEIELLRQQDWQVHLIYVYAHSRLRYQRLTKASERLLADKRFGLHRQLNYADFIRSDLREYSWGLARMPSLPGVHLMINEWKSLDRLTATVLEHVRSVGIGRATL